MKTILLNNIISDVVHLVFPKQCVACQGELSSNEQHICSICDAQLVPTRFHNFDAESPMDKLFWGRVNVKSTYAHFYFQKQSSIQSILFTLKYKNGKSLGKLMGERIGRALVGSEFFDTNAVLIPVPLHPNKEFVRGYNQSLSIAQGISSITKTKVDAKSVLRKANNATQTRKNRFQRWENVSDIFKVRPTIRRYTHLVLIDDVITTGSTIESLIKQIHEMNPSIQISVVTLAIT